MKYLLVGDVHATVNELDDCESLVDLICEHTDKDTTVVFLGDQYHTHAMVRVEVIDFWNRAIKRTLKYSKGVIAIVGNHDMPGDSSKTMNSMMANLAEGLIVVDKPYMADDQTLFVPYYYNTQKLVEDVNQHRPLTVICHQTFNGAKYENGFYAKDGVDAELMHCNQVISGHIHTPSIFGKVEYIGAPRWRTASDANLERHIHLYETTTRGLKLVTKIPTRTHCRQILQASIYEDGTFEGRTDAFDGDLLHIDIHGSKQFCDIKKLEFAAPNIRIRTFPKTERVIKVKESEGIAASFAKYMQSFCETNQLDLKKVSELIDARLGRA